MFTGVTTFLQPFIALVISEKLWKAIWPGEVSKWLQDSCLGYLPLWGGSCSPPTRQDFASWPRKDRSVSGPWIKCCISLQGRVKIHSQKKWVEWSCANYAPSPTQSLSDVPSYQFLGEMPLESDLCFQNIPDNKDKQKCVMYLCNKINIIFIFSSICLV